ncbi:MAG: hypothetical protein ABIJ00_10045 [Candidatus Eisenbacteria bacterium]
MCCESKPGRKTFAVWACGPECCEGGPSFRRFITSKEKRECMEEYKGQLEKELAGVKERIQELEGK